LCSCVLTAVVLETDFLTMATEKALGDSWTGRVSIHPRGNQAQLVSLIFYVYNEGEGEIAYAKTAENIMEEIYGHTPEVGGVRLYVMATPSVVLELFIVAVEVVGE